ncbi:hypothetical protein [Streptomyces sp. NPDC056982]|uniref:hypothetical protein n=1 Tax=Streptomyces sp. NPDC056982 TaxID=3345986 RepID=UPI0036250C2E
MPVALAQLYTRDVPLPSSPPGADLLQVLWCRFDHSAAHPRTALFWRSSVSVTDSSTPRPSRP